MLLNPRLVTLCRVSKAVQEFSTRTLYRDLSFSEVSLLLKCCHTLIKRELSANSVRSFRIELNDLGHPLSAFYRILGDALHRLSRLQDLKIDHAAFGFQLVLNACHFPSLFHFRTRLRLNRPLSDFIHRHSSTITGLYLDGKLLKHPSFLPRPVNLPQLTSFSGNPAFVRFLDTHKGKPTLHSIHFSTHEALIMTDKEAFDVVNHLRVIGDESLENVSMIGSAFSDPLPKYIAKYLKNVKVLGLIHLNVSDNEEPYVFSAEDLCEDIKLLLPELQQLERLVVNHVPFEECHPGLSMEKNHKFVTEFYSLCPKLEVVLLPNDNEWHRTYLPGSTLHLWLPDPLKDVALDDALWLIDMLFTEGKKDPLSRTGKLVTSAAEKYLELIHRRFNYGPSTMEARRTA
ncbi:hypothetical protein BDP27DRAFT_611712 [Rhodocollybia butyracea]|uniref:Uncharacterized protein n=1 Tax=Rhodocollybia butyracea TaxID=206335 RepID=A0A9P5U910_9AGAR|nr:hypothetical protein BDP27DRAFT_611712 [Rhodocollybia butyracea]